MEPLSAAVHSSAALQALLQEAAALHVSCGTMAMPCRMLHTRLERPSHPAAAAAATAGLRAVLPPAGRHSQRSGIFRQQATHQRSRCAGGAAAGRAGR